MHSVAEKCATLGLHPGGHINLSDLRHIHNQFGIDVYIFFDERIARDSTMNEVLEDFFILPLKARPYLEIKDFLRVIEEEELMLPEEGEVEAEIIEIGETECISCGGSVYQPSSVSFSSDCLSFAQTQEFRIHRIRDIFYKI